MILKSNLSNMLVMDDDKEQVEDLQTMEVNLADNLEALIGFKGMADEYISKLSIYKASRIDAPISH